MTGHADERLIPYLRGELRADEAREVETHLAGCPGCRGAGAAFERLAAELGRSQPPPPRWGAYRAELRDKLDRRLRGQRADGAGRWLWPPLPAALAAGLVAVLVYSGLPGGRGWTPGPEDPAGLENAMLATRLDLISRLELMQRLDLLEDLEVIGGLDRLPLGGEG